MTRSKVDKEMLPGYWETGGLSMACLEGIREADLDENFK